MGFQEIPHSADCAIRVWAANLPSLLVEAAQGLNVVSGICLEAGERKILDVHLPASDDEGLLINWLSEIIFLQETRNLGFDDFELALSHAQLDAVLHGSRIISRERTIKAATFHNLKILTMQGRMETEITFDV